MYNKDQKRELLDPTLPMQGERIIMMMTKMWTKKQNKNQEQKKNCMEM